MGRPSCPGVVGRFMSFRVLIVEDNPDGADSLARFLEMSGFEVKVAYTGAEGVASALAGPPDAVLCDINMPEVDGFEVARRIREGLATPPLLIAVTARREAELLRPAGQAGFDQYFLKPADPVEIGGLLSEYADGGPVLGGEVMRPQLIW
jgi:CheY-like chemotaxis protein